MGTGFTSRFWLSFLWCYELMLLVVPYALFKKKKKNDSVGFGIKIYELDLRCDKQLVLGRHKAFGSITLDLVSTGRWLTKLRLCFKHFVIFTSSFYLLSRPIAKYIYVRVFFFNFSLFLLCYNFGFRVSKLEGAENLF